MVESSACLTTELLQEVLRSDAFAQVYGAKVRLTPVMDRSQTSQTKERIRRCQAQHKQILDSLKTEYRGGIELLDSVSNSISLTLRQMILKCKSPKGHRLFISVDRNFYSSEINFTFPKKYEAEAHDYMLSIGAYLYREYGEPVLQFFTSDEQARIKNTKFDDDGKPILEIDSMLDTLAEETEEDWMLDPIPDEEAMDLTRPNNTNAAQANGTSAPAAGGDPPTANTKSPDDSNARYQLPDTDSIGTWGSKLQGAAGNDDLNSLANNTQTTSASSNTSVTTESCLSHIEGFMASTQQDMKSMQTMFTSLLQKLDTGPSMGTPQGYSDKDTDSQVASHVASGAPSAQSGDEPV